MCRLVVVVGLYMGNLNCYVLPFDSFCSDWCKWSLQSVRRSTAQMHNRTINKISGLTTGKGGIFPIGLQWHTYGAYKKEREKKIMDIEMNTPLWSGWDSSHSEQGPGHASCWNVTPLLTQANTHEHTHIYRVLIHVKRKLRFNLYLVYKYNGSPIHFYCIYMSVYKSNIITWPFVVQWMSDTINKHEAAQHQIMQTCCSENVAVIRWL